MYVVGAPGASVEAARDEPGALDGALKNFEHCQGIIARHAGRRQPAYEEALPIESCFAVPNVALNHLEFALALSHHMSNFSRTRPPRVDHG